MKKSNAQSRAELLDEADRMATRIAFSLFAQEQDRRAYAYPEVWVPGEPLVAHDTFYNIDENVSYLRPVDQSVYVREMVVIEDDLEDYRPRVGEITGRVYGPRCLDCETWWQGEEPCFVCGEHWTSTLSPFAVSHTHALTLNSAQDWAAWYMGLEFGEYFELLCTNR